jgi:cytochrome c553
MRIVLGVLVTAALVGCITAFFAFRPRVPAAERGRRLAERTGCFACHGPGGSAAQRTPGAPTVPFPRSRVT